MNKPSTGTTPGHNPVHQDDKNYSKKIFRKKKLEGFFLFITSQCNSKCRTCFYHDRLNSKDDLTFDQIKTISETTPMFDKLWLSGGEPLLRKDLVDILEMFYVNNHARVINFPTNGLRPDLMEEKIRETMERCPDYEIHLNFSLDGIGKNHDMIRGIPGNFKKTLASMEKADQLYRNSDKVFVNVATVMTPENYDDLYDLALFLYHKNIITTQFMEVLRGDPKDPATRGLTKEQVVTMHDRMMPLYDKMSDRMFSEFSGWKRSIARMFFLGFMKFVNGIQAENVEGPSHWGMDCTAGKTTIVIDANGDFRSCEMRPPIGNLRDYGYNVLDALNSPAMQKEIEEIGGGAKANCWCTHACWIMSSMKFSPSSILFRVPAAYRRYNKNRDKNFQVPKPDIAGRL